jgi:hypothetical protein
MSAMQSMLTITVGNGDAAKEEKGIKEEGCPDRWDQARERERVGEEVASIEGRAEGITGVIQIEAGRE